MHRSSTTIGALATALAKAQGELANPEKSLTATLPAAGATPGGRSFRYASLASGLDLVRKCLGRHAIAMLQTTAIEDAHIRLTTLLAHASGEWIASDLPVCAVSELAAPHRVGAALTYARRYALFALVGIAGEDDLDAPDLLTVPAGSQVPLNGTRNGASRGRSGGLPQPAELAPAASAALREAMLAEIGQITDGDGLAAWIHRRMRDKNALTDADARAIEAACARLLPPHDDDTGDPIPDPVTLPPPTDQPQPHDATHLMDAASTPASARRTVVPRVKPLRQRSKAHLAFVAAQPCLICQRTPCDAHHLRFAQPRALGRKVSDEFTVPLCRDHHHELHRHGNEAAWWANLKLTPLETAKELWLTSPVHDPVLQTRDAATAGAMP
jgi:hypothetical protein